MSAPENQVAKLKVVLAFFDKWEKNIIQRQNQLYQKEEKNGLDLNYWKEEL
jgi:hypothetical protein